MRTRIFTMIALWLMIGAAFGLGGLLGGQLLLLLVSLGVIWELTGLLRKCGFKLNVMAMFLALLSALAGHFWGFASAGTSVGLILILLAHWKESPGTLSAGLGACVLVGMGMGSLNAIAHLPNSMALWWTVWVFATVKLSDAGAYLWGSQLGKKALVPKISPGKTVVGFWGALLSGLIMGIVGAPLFLNPWLGPVLGILLAFFGSVGDLLESALKRHVGAKDSGKILPGIGGILDLCDSLIVAAPIGYVALWLWS